MKLNQKHGMGGGAVGSRCPYICPGRMGWDVIAA